eukprot:TRINITY_DN8467_c0_g2_i1.p3 TRINITY_DN8467_c0_g2~~TRINITY_DN8467_c0_g2_i1.p3  ORF type:complete len:282 (+),score=81.17 TRINITY_DN8467_c0_g2_i1:92-937(+)
MAPPETPGERQGPPWRAQLYAVTAAPLGEDYISSALVSPTTKLHRAHCAQRETAKRQGAYLTRLQQMTGELQCMMDDNSFTDEISSCAIVPRPAAEPARRNRLVADRTPDATPVGTPVQQGLAGPRAEVLACRPVRPARRSIVPPQQSPLPGAMAFSRSAHVDRWLQCDILRIPESALLRPRNPTRRKGAPAGPTDERPPSGAPAGRRKLLDKLLAEQRTLHEAASATTSAYKQLLERADKWHQARGAAMAGHQRRAVSEFLPEETWSAAGDYYFDISRKN